MSSNHTIPVVNKKEPLILGLGDLILMFLGLWTALVLRYAAWPSNDLIQAHLPPFSIVFLLSLVVFYISGLYGRTVHLTRGALPGMIIRSQIANGLMAIILFYFVPSWSVTPKINLLIYLVLSSLFIILWRLNTYQLLSLRRKHPALVVGNDAETDELVAEMSANPRLGLSCREQIAPEALANRLMQSLENGHEGFQYLVADLEAPAVRNVLPELYHRFFGKVNIIDIHELYEDVFDRIPLSRLDHAWILSTISATSPKIYDVVKRAIDIVLGLLVGIVACLFWPFVALAIKIEDGGPITISQQRVGQGDRPIRIIKFRSMQRNESDKWVAESTNQVTRVGRFLRRSRIDELPQALAVLRGEMSLIGPRADVSGLAERLEKEIPYYAVRTIIAPGLTGWAQINQEKPPQSVEETKRRLSYDLYYITHRSLGLDLQIVLRTMRTLLRRVGM